MRKFRGFRMLTVMLAVGGWMLVGCGGISNLTGPIDGDKALAGFSTSSSSEGVTSLEIQWRNGTVSVVVDTDATEILATGTKSVIAPDNTTAEAQLEELDIRFNVTDSAGRLVLILDAPAEGIASYSADVFVRLPVGVALTVESTSGNVQVVSNTGATTIDVLIGDISVFNQDGDVVATTTTGNIEVNGADGGVRATTEQGNIVINTDPGDNGLIVANTLSGVVTIVVPGSTSAELRLEATTGTVIANLDAFLSLNPTFNPTLVTATLNGGGGQIVGTTGNGFVTFSGIGN